MTTSNEETCTLYTAQAPVVLDAIEREGLSFVKREYIQNKYGDQSWVFQQAYSFFAQHAPAYGDKPAYAESGIWCYCDRRWASSGAGGCLLELEVPADQAVLFDLRVWNKMLNLQYVGADEADEEAFEQTLASRGVRNHTEIFSTPFHPVLKQQVLASWQRLFDSAQDCPPEYLEAGLWEIRKEWLVGAQTL